MRIEATSIFIAAPGGTFTAHVKDDIGYVAGLVRDALQQDRPMSMTGLTDKPVIISAHGARNIVGIWTQTIDVVDPRLAVPGGHVPPGPRTN